MNLRSTVPVLLLACFSACSPFGRGSSVAAQSASRSGSYWRDATRTLATQDLESPPPLVVAPDRALARFEITTAAEHRAAATSKLRTRTAETLRALPSQCRASEEDVAIVTKHGEDYVASATVRLDMDVRGLGSARDRTSRVEACLTVLDTLAGAWGDDTTLTVSALVWSVDDLSAHREALLTKKLGTLTAVVRIAEAAHAPGQFAADDLRCTSNGAVHVLSRTAAGLALDVDLPCVHAPARGVPVGSAPVTGGES